MPSGSSSSVRVFYPKLDRPALVEALRRRLPRLGTLLPLRRVVLFGSWAKGRQTVASDVDLLIVYGGEARADAYSLTRTTLDVPRLEPHLYTEAEYGAAAATVGRMIDGGVVLWEAPA
jgi:predicted nucleotidyltransferase